MKKISFLLALIISIQSCGFTPVYISNDNVNFKIESVTFEGDQELNNYINIGLKKYISKGSSNSNYKIYSVSKYSKQAQSKDAKGNTQSFKVEGSITFKVTGNNQTFNLTYSEQSDLNNLDDTFELKSYENSIKQNFASSMVEKLILDLSNKQ